MTVILIIWIFLLHGSWSRGTSVNYDHIMKILRNLRNASSFYEENFKQVNLDSVFGVRAAEGALHNLLRHHSDKLFQFTKPLKDIYKKINGVATKALKNFEDTGDAYYYAFKYIINKKWHYESPLRPPTDQLPKFQPIREELEEEFSDQCMRNLMGTQDFHSKEKCVVTIDCWKAMTRFGATGYYLTHQALFFIIADVNECMQEIERRYGYKKYPHFTYLGSTILAQMKDSMKKELTSAEDRDLFLEQGVVCRWLGIDSCFNLEWLDAVLVWQDPSGCIRETYGVEEDNEKDEADVETGRKLLVELTLSGGCLSHATGLYIAYLATSLHWLLIEYNDDFSPKRYSSFNPRLIYALPFLIVFLVWMVRHCKRRLLCKRWRL